MKGVMSVGLILGGLGFYVSDRLLPEASYAVLAAPAMIVRAADSGVVQHAVRVFSMPAPDETLATITANASDPEVRSAAVELASARAEAETLGTLTEQVEALVTRHSARRSVLSAERKQQLERSLAVTDALFEVRKAAAEAAELVRAQTSKARRQFKRRFGKMTVAPPTLPRPSARPRTTWSPVLQPPQP
jgi:hypothetical protein